MKQHHPFYYLYPLFLAAIPWIYLALIWNSLPSTIPTHFGLSGEPDRFGARNEVFLGPAILSVMSTGIYFLFMNIQKLDPKRYSEANTKIMQKIAYVLPVFFTGISLLILYWTTRKKTEGINFIFTGVSLLFAFIGNLMHSIKPNYFAGFRLPWTLENEENWRKTHQLASRIWFAGGIFLAIASLVLPPVPMFIFFFAGLITMVVIPAVYSYRMFKNSTDAKK